MATEQDLKGLRNSLKKFIEYIENRLSTIQANKLSKKNNVIEVSGDVTASLYNVHILLASVTLTLPANPEVGDWVNFSNRSGETTGTIARNGNNIMGTAEDMSVDTENARATLTYINANQGWVITNE